MNTKEVGNEYENIAAKYLKDAGLRIIERNYSCKIGEIDIIAMDEKENTLVFAEVKYRKEKSHGGADFAVNYKKQAKIRKVAMNYMLYRKISQNTFCRFDCVLITNNEINYIKNAFGGL